PKPNRGDAPAPFCFRKKGGLGQCPKQARAAARLAKAKMTIAGSGQSALAARSMNSAPATTTVSPTARPERISTRPS
ncbi:MAG: hypothetical protein RLZZ501_2600, partial [Pseudomonadota bacterium]